MSAFTFPAFSFIFTTIRPYFVQCIILHLSTNYTAIDQNPIIPTEYHLSFLSPKSQQKTPSPFPPEKIALPPFNMIRYNINSLVIIADMQLVRVKIETLLELTALRQTENPLITPLPHPIYPPCKTLLNMLNEEAKE